MSGSGAEIGAGGKIVVGAGVKIGVVDRADVEREAEISGEEGREKIGDDVDQIEIKIIGVGEVLDQRFERSRAVDRHEMIIA